MSRQRDVAMEIPQATARGIRLVVLDVDGVMTDGGVYIGVGRNGEATEFKRFDVQDGIGIKMLGKAGIHVAIVSGRTSASTSLRAAELGIADVYQDDRARKVPILRELLAARELQWPEVALLGDDLADLPALRKVGLPATVANGTAEVREVALWRSASRGGRGAVREFAEALLKARGEWDVLVEEYCRERGG